MKRGIDFIFSLLLLVLLSPVMLAAAITVYLSMGWPVFFRQLRPGRGGKPFAVLKFRSMRDARGKDNMPLSDGERLTRVGRFLRATSIDELPEIWNVLVGDMSLVGPRPLLMEYLPRYSAEQARRHAVRPGITGWAQVNGRNALSWEKKFELDVWYVDHRSFWLDLKILLMTVRQVLSRQGISGEGQATMSRFEGNSL